MTPAQSPSTGQARRLLGLTGQDWAAIGIGLVVATLPAVMPAMVGILTDAFGMGPAAAGYVVSANMGGILAGTVSSALLSRRISYRRLLEGGLALMVLGNILTMIVEAYSHVVATRFLSGFGEGVAAAIVYALMARCAMPSRALALYATGQAIVGATGMAALPTLVANYGWQAFYVLVSIGAIPAIAISAYAVRGLDAAVEAGGPKSRIPMKGVAALGAIFLFFAGMSIIWAFMEQIGEQIGLATATITAAMSGTAIANLVGAVSVALFAHRLKQMTATVVGAALILTAAILIGLPAKMSFIAALGLLNFAWGFQFPFLFRCVADIGDNGASASFTPVATGGALMVGPALGGALFEYAGLEALRNMSLVFIAFAFVIVTLLSRNARRGARSALLATESRNA